MKTNLINSLIKYLIEKKYFNLINSEDEKLDFTNGPTALIKNVQGATVFLEIIDADRCDAIQLSRMMENGAAILNNINGTNAYVFKLFLFDNTPSEEKVNIINNGQLDIIPEKKFLKCISVNIADKIVQKHFTEPYFDANLVKTINKFFAKNLDSKETSTEDISELLLKRNKDFEIQLKAKTPWVTYGLIAVNVLVWLLLKLLSIKNNAEYSDLLAPYGAKVNSLILNGEYWRFISAMFLHSNEIHLLVNCYSLYMVGSQVEKLYGHVNMTAIYFLSGFIGSIASFAFSPNASVGASGAIFGLLGAMLFFAIKRPSLLKSGFGANLITTLVINLIYGLMNERIDNHAHVGGLVGGFLTTGAVYTAKEETSKDKIIRLSSFILVIVVTLGGLYYSFNNDQNKFSLKITELENYVSQSKFVESEELAEQILEQEPRNKDIKTQALWYLCVSEASQTDKNKFAEAEEHAKQLLTVSPMHGHFMLGVLYYNTQDFNNLDKAKEHLQKAKELNSPNMDAINNILSNIEELQKSK